MSILPSPLPPTHRGGTKKHPHSLHIRRYMGCRAIVVHGGARADTASARCLYIGEKVHRDRERKRKAPNRPTSLSFKRRMSFAESSSDVSKSRPKGFSTTTRFHPAKRRKDEARHQQPAAKPLKHGRPGREDRAEITRKSTDHGTFSVREREKTERGALIRRTCIDRCSDSLEEGMCTRRLVQTL